MTIAAKEPKKFVAEWQNTDENGNPIGPPQHFEGDTHKELIDELIKNNKNANREMYKEKRARKLGDLITPDPERPMQKFERKPLSADERVRLAAAIKDPATAPEAIKTMIESEIGAPLEVIRQGLTYGEVQQRIQMAQIETDRFLGRHPEYVQCDSNQEMILKWLEKRNYAITVKNLELAYEDLGDMLTMRVPEPRYEPERVPAAATPAVEESPAPTPQSQEIPAAATPAPAITDKPAEVQPAPEIKPKQSSSGLGRDHASITPSAVTPKAKEIPYQTLARMNSTQYTAWINDPANKELVALMDKRA